MTLLNALTYRLQRLWLAALASVCAVTQPAESRFNTGKTSIKHRKQGCPAVSAEIT